MERRAIERGQGAGSGRRAPSLAPRPLAGTALRAPPRAPVRHLNPEVEAWRVVGAGALAEEGRGKKKIVITAVVTASRTTTTAIINNDNKTGGLQLQKTGVAV